MHINILNIKDKIIIDEDFTIDNDKLKSIEILELNNGHVKGYINEDLLIDITISGNMVLPCSVTLKPVDYPFSCHVCDDLATILKEIGQNLENTIDILPIIWENILVEKPLKVVSDQIDDIKLQGDGWKFIQGEVDNINPELEKLKDLLKEEV